MGTYLKCSAISMRFMDAVLYPALVCSMVVFIDTIVCRRMDDIMIATAVYAAVTDRLFSTIPFITT